MTPYILILTILAPGAVPQSQRVGVMISLPACHAAGQGMALVIVAALPDARIDYTCLPVGDPA